MKRLIFEATFVLLLLISSVFSKVLIPSESHENTTEGIRPSTSETLKLDSEHYSINLGEKGSFQVDEKILPQVSLEISQEVLSYFKQIELLLQNLMNQRSRKRRAAPRKTSSKCTTSQTVLSGLKTEINNVLDGISSPTSINCVLDDYQASKECNELLKFIQCGVHHLNMGYLDAVSKGVSLKEFQTLQNAYNHLATESKRQLDNVEKEVNAEKLREINDLRQTIQRLQEALNKATKELSDKTLKSCISELSSGKAQSAVDDFMALKNDDILSHIIKEAYMNYGGIKIFENILSFVKKLPTCNLERLAMPALLEAVKQNGGQESSQMLRYSLDLDRCMKSSNLQEEVNSLAKKVVSSWGTKVRAGDNEPIYQFVRADSSAFRRFLKDLITSAYDGRISNAEEVLKFIQGLPFKQDDVIAYPVLFDEMKKSNGFDGHEMVMLAWLADIRAKDPGDNVSDEDKNRIAGIRQQLPSGIKALLWDSYIYIRSKPHSSTYLGFKKVERFNPYGMPMDNDDSAYDLVSCPSDTFRFNQKWDVDRLDNGRYFKFRNRDSEKYFGRDNAFRSTSSGYTSDVAGTTHQYHWEVIPIHNGEYFYLKNRDNGRILKSYDINGGWKAIWNKLPSDCAFTEAVSGGYDGDSKIKWSIS